jgi:hypothetical protein
VDDQTGREVRRQMLAEFEERSFKAEKQVESTSNANPFDWVDTLDYKKHPSFKKPVRLKLSKMSDGLKFLNEVFYQTWPVGTVIKRKPLTYQRDPNDHQALKA